MGNSLDTLIELLEKLKKNRANVTEEVLQTKYKKSYDKLKRDIADAAEQVLKDITLSNVKIAKGQFNDFADEVNAMVKRLQRKNGLMKKISADLFIEMDIDKFCNDAFKLEAKVKEIAKKYEEKA